MKFKAIKFEYMKNDEHFQFHLEFGRLVRVTGVELLKVEPWFTAWETAMASEDDALKRIAKSARTEEIQEVDAQRNLMFRGMADTCKTSVNHYDINIKTAAREVKIVFDTYGNLTRKGLTQKTSAIVNFLKELNEHHLENVKKIGLDGWAVKLNEANEQCSQLMRARWNEVALRPDIVMRDARAKTDAAYYKIMDRIEARYVLEEGEVFGEFIKRHGVVIDTYKAAITRRRGKGGDDGGASSPTPLVAE